ncbi:MAG: 2,3-bisphosphoglycerate-independent phosphoglycerate mutase [Patescibacteria group bacterium]
MNKKPFLLIILDGWGVASPSRGNGISLSNTPNFTNLVQTFPTLTLQASGEAVGLSWGEMGNSEVGHMNLGGGKVIFQELPRITRAISDGSFQENQGLNSAIEHVKKNNSKLHLLGLVSNGGIHSFNEHLYALVELAKQKEINQVFIHVFLDGRDTPHNSGLTFIQKLQNHLNEVGVGKIATISGRFYAMDRDNRWERTQKAYLALAEGQADNKADNPVTAVEQSYNQKIYDEEFIPTMIMENGQTVAKIDDNDALIYFNFRADRARQLTKALILPGFEKFQRPRSLKNLHLVTMTKYEKDLPVTVAFPKETIENPLGKVLAANKMTQFHIAETEKYAHVTFFFNCGKEDPFKGETRALVPSPSVASYDQKPGMSANEVKDRLIQEINSGKQDFLVVNFANADMVGHTGNLEAVIEAVGKIDVYLGEVIKAVLKTGGSAIVTADHGNAEELVNLQTGEIHKEHTTNPVPCIIVGEGWRKTSPNVKSDDLSKVVPIGVLSDVAPTILSIMGKEKHPEMTGRDLLNYIK